jgi:protein TonB
VGIDVTLAASADGAAALGPNTPSAFSIWREEARESLRRRSTALILASVLHVGLLLLLLNLAPPEMFEDSQSKPTTVTLVPGEEAPPAPEPEPADKPRPAGGGAPAKAVQAPPRPAPISRPRPAPAQPSDEPPLELWEGMEKFNLANVPSSGPAKTAGTPGASADAGDAVVGTAPGGQPLYGAQWHRRPSGAELATYLPARMQNGWGMVACRTAPDYRVEDCKEIGQSPAGSGLSRAVRLAAWQFRVRPPRVGGKSMVGEWVQIRIEWTTGVPR